MVFTNPWLTKYWEISEIEKISPQKTNSSQHNFFGLQKPLYRKTDPYDVEMPEVNNIVICSFSVLN